MFDFNLLKFYLVPALNKIIKYPLAKAKFKQLFTGKLKRKSFGKISGLKRLQSVSETNQTNFI